VSECVCVCVCVCVYVCDIKAEWHADPIARAHTHTQHTHIHTHTHTHTHPSFPEHQRRSAKERSKREHLLSQPHQEPSSATNTHSTPLLSSLGATPTPAILPPANMNSPAKLPGISLGTRAARSPANLPGIWSSVVKEGMVAMGGRSSSPANSPPANPPPHGIWGSVVKEGRVVGGSNVATAPPANLAGIWGSVVKEGMVAMGGRNAPVKEGIVATAPPVKFPSASPGTALPAKFPSIPAKFPSTSPGSPYNQLGIVPRIYVSLATTASVVPDSRESGGGGEVKYICFVPQGLACGYICL
jgi:hypothetical protein